MNDLFSTMAFQLGTGGVLGFVIGYAVKKVLKIIAIFAGIVALFILYLGYSGIINVNYDKIIEIVDGVIGNFGSISHILAPIIASLPFAGSFAVGATVGLKKG